MQDIRVRLRREDRKRETGAVALILCFLVLMLVPALLAQLASDPPQRLAFLDRAGDGSFAAR